MVNIQIDEEIKSYVLDGNHNMIPSRTSASILTKRGYYDYLLKRYSDNTTDSIQEILYRLVNNIENIPLCPECGNPITFSINNRCYSKWCSAKCRNNSEEVKTKNKERVSNSLRKVYSEHKCDILEKRSKRLNELYGVNISSGSPFSIKEVRDKSKESINKTYGVDNVFSLKYFRENVESIRERSILLWKERGLNIRYDNDEVVVIGGCDVHGDVRLSLSDFNNRTKLYRLNNSVICPICNPLSYNSGEELKLKQFLNDNHIEYVLNDRSIISPYELDFYIPSKKIAIEMNGLYYHSESGGKTKYYHRNKSELCDKQGIQLLHIWEYDWINRNDIILSILKSKLGIADKRIYARNCIFKNVSSKDAMEFCEHNHLQGYVQSKYKFGLYYDDELVSVMSFGKCRPVLGVKDDVNSCELYRFCNKLNTVVVGGASKLFTNAVEILRKEGFQKIITYAKRDMSNGDLYYKLGFSFDGYTAPNYNYYNIYGDKLSRYKCMKHKIIEKCGECDMTENEMMKRAGYYKCYDSGNLKFSFDI